MSQFADAPCQTNPELFFSTAKKEVAQAKSQCASCIHRDVCLEDCLDYEELAGSMRFGIFGGLTPQERTHLRARRP